MVLSDMHTSALHFIHYIMDLKASPALLIIK